MKQKKLLFTITSLLLLTSCEAPLPTVEEGNKITYTDEGYEIPFEYGALDPLLATNDKEEDLKLYFENNGMHYAETTIYALEYKGKLMGREFRVSFTYDASLESQPFTIVSQWSKDDKNVLPDAYFYFSAHFDIDKFQDIDYTGYYYYDYNDKETLEYYSTNVPVTYTNIEYGDSPLYKSVVFEVLSGDTMPARAIRESDELGASIFECVRVAATFVQTTLTNINENYKLW